MDKLLKNLYDGTLEPSSRYYAKTKEYQEVCRLHRKHYQEFIEKLQQHDVRLVGEFLNIFDDQISEIPFEISEVWIDGFRLGSRMTMEILDS